MYFRKIGIKNWRGLYDSELTLDLDQGLNVITGPNESGKSTTLEAIRLALTTKGSSRKQAVKDLQPWDTDLKPHLEIEFRADGKDYRLEKTYLKSSGNSSFAEKLEGEEWTTIAEDDEAHSRFLRTIDLTESEGFFRSLWVPQGKNTGLSVSKGLQSRIEEAVGAATSELGEAILEYAVGRVGDPENEGWLTRKRRDPSSGSPWKEAVERLEELRGELDELEEKREEHYDRLQKVGELRDRQEELEEERRKKKEELEEERALKEEWDRFRELKKSADKARERYNRLMKLKQNWDDQIEEIEDREAQLASLEEELEDLKEKERELESREAEKRESYESSRVVLEELKAKKEYLKRLRALKINNRIGELTRNIEELGAPDPETFGGLEELHEELSAKRSQLEASELSLHFSPEEAIGGKLTLDGQEEELDLNPGDEVEKGAAKSLELDLNGVGRLRVETGMERALEVKEQLEDYEERLREGFQEYDVDGWEELKALYEKGEKLRSERDELSTVRADLELEEAESVDEGALEGFRASHSGELDRNFLASLSDLKQEEVRGRVNELTSDIEAKGDEVERKETEWREKKKDLEEVRRKIRDKENELARVRELKERELERLTEIKRSLRDFDERFAEKPVETGDSQRGFDRKAEKESDLYRELVEAWGEARDEKEGLEHELERKKPEGREVTGETIEELEGEVSRLEEELSNLDGEIKRLQGRIGDTADGLHERIRSKNEEIEREQRQLDSRRKETRSHELLRLALEEAKAETSRKYLDPIRQKIVPRLRKMTGRRYESVNFDSDLKPDSLVRDRRGAEAGKGELSFGTREQVFFLTRLAMAEVISDKERIPVVFDDSLVNTDRERMQYAVEFLREASGTCQVIFFTCHDYGWGEGANEVELEELP